MSQIVTDEQGNQHEFPDEATPGMIAQALGVKLPVEQMSGAGRLPAMAGSGVLEGIAGLVDLPSKLDPIPYLAKKLGFNGLSETQNSSPAMGLTNQLGLTQRPDLEPQNAMERYMAAGARGVGGQLPIAMATGGMASVPAALMSAASGAGAGMGAQAGQEIAPDHPVLGAVAGGIAGGVAPYGIASGVGRLGGLAQGAVDPVRAATAKDAIERGIPVETNQLFAGTKTPRTPQQVEALNKGVSRDLLGEETNKITPEFLDKSADRIGAVFENSAKKIGNISVDAAYVGRLQQLYNDVRDSTLDQASKDAIYKQMTKVIPPSTPAWISGDTFLELSKSTGGLGRLLKDKDQAVREFASEIRHNLTDAMESTAKANGMPEIVKELGDARFQWKNLKMLQSMSGGSGIVAGDINPSALPNAVKRSYPSYGLGRAGEAGDYGDIAKNLLLTPPGAAKPGFDIHGWGKAFPFGLGLVAAERAAEVYPVEALATAAIAAGLGGAKTGARAAVNSNWFRNELIRRSLEGGGASPMFSTSGGINPNLPSTQ